MVFIMSTKPSLNIHYRARKISVAADKTMLELRGGLFVWLPTVKITFEHHNRDKFGYLTVPLEVVKARNLPYPLAEVEAA